MGRHIKWFCLQCLLPLFAARVDLQGQCPCHNVKVFLSRIRETYCTLVDAADSLDRINPSLSRGYREAQLLMTINLCITIVRVENDRASAFAIR